MSEPFTSLFSHLALCVRVCVALPQFLEGPFTRAFYFVTFYLALRVLYVCVRVSARSV